MLHQQNPFSRPSAPPSLWQVLTGAILGIALTYAALYAVEIIQGEHVLDFEMITNLLWLGVGVLLFGWYEQFSTKSSR